MIQRLKLLTIGVAIACFLIGCSSDAPEKRIFSFLFNNQWDSLKSHLEKPPDDLVLILNSGERLENRYSFSLNDSVLVFKGDDDLVDSVKYSWSDSSQTIQVDSSEVMKLFSRETRIRSLMVLSFIKKNKPTRAWNWLTYKPALHIDSLYGEFFKDMYYAVDLDEYAKASPSLQRAWSAGHANSGLALSHWYVLQDDRPEGIKILKTLASRKNSEAMVRLGQIYETYFSEFGYLPPADAKPESSFLWYQEAASLGNSEAMYSLGYIYEQGINKTINLDSALYWYRRSSDLGESLASSTIATLLLRQEEPEVSMDSIMFWFSKSIEQQPSNGYLELGDSYEQGLFGEPDKETALYYYMKADSAGSPVAGDAIRRLKGLDNGHGKKRARLRKS